MVNVMKRVIRGREDDPASIFGPRRDWKQCLYSMFMLQLNYTPTHITFINTGTQFKATVHTDL